MPNLGSLGSISSSGKSKPAPLTFPAGWGAGPIFTWYNSLADHGARFIQTLQIRKDVTGPVPHRFIVLHMRNNRIHRFDRRPQRGPNSDTKMVGLLANQAVASEDTYVVDIPLSSIEQDSQCEVELLLHGQVDLLAVISACYAISKDDSAREYTFLRHNCFFFSWTILMVVSRHHMPYEVPLYGSIMDRFQSQLDRLTSKAVDEVIALFLDIVIETVTIFREKTGPSLKGVSTIVRAAWGLPIGVFRFIWRQLFTVRLLQLGLRDQLTKMFKLQLSEMVGHAYKATLSTPMARDLLDAHLWIEETQSNLKENLEKETMKILWVSLLEAISSGLGDIKLELLEAQLTNPNPKMSLIGRNAAQLCTIWNAALHGGLQAVKRAGQDLEGLSHKEAFDRAWFAASDGAFDVAHTVVKNTSSKINNPDRDAMWDSIFALWNDCWEEAHKIVQPRSVQTVEKLVENLLAVGTDVVIQDIRESKVKTIQTRMSKVSYSVDCRL